MTGTDVALAIDVGGTKSAAGLVRRDGQVLAWRARPARVERGPLAMIDDYVAMAGAVMGEAGLSRKDLIGAGAGCGGPLDPATGVVYSPPNLPGWDELPLAALLSEKLGLQVWIDNDANAAALAEHTYGAGRGVDPLVYLTISTGIGGGVIIAGKVYHGATGNAAELGHMIVRAGGRPCDCGGRGCLETYCSGRSIAARAREALAEESAVAQRSALGKLSRPPRAEDVVALAGEGDPLASALWQETLDLLAAGIVNAHRAFEPRRIILGGGVTRAGNALFVPLRERAPAMGMRHLLEKLEIVPAALGDQVGLLGAAAVAFSRLPAQETSRGL